MVDYLNTLYLYSDIKITRDYSVVHDLTPQAWLTYLKTQTAVFNEGVNYYRVPSVIRVEGHYDDLRKVTYGCLENKNLLMPNVYTPTFERPYFFWVDEVRLVKQGSESRVSGPQQLTVNDVVELVISPDVWSNCNGQFELYDSWIVRRHVDRWYDDGGTKKPEYYPDAADPVGGAYDVESNTDIGSPIEVTINGTTFEVDLQWIVINLIDSSGVQHFYIGCVGTRKDTGAEIPVNMGDYLSNTSFRLEDILTGRFYDRMGITVDYIQSITVMPSLAKFSSCAYGWTPNNIPSVCFDDSIWDYTQYFDSSYVFQQGDPHVMGYFHCDSKSNMDLLRNGLYAGSSETVSPSAPVWDDPTVDTQYKDAREPMMYRSPARMRKVTNGLGGTVIDVPDIEAFQTSYTVRTLLDISTATTFVFGGSDIVRANGLGNVGVIEAATLPIFNTAWKSYSAINRVGDEIALNAQQSAAMANGLIGAATSGGMAALMNPVAGVLAAAGSIAGAGVQMYSNSENLRAKQAVVRNSPCNMKSTGSGLGASVANWVDVRYLVLKLDDVSLEKLRTQYYYYGYNVGEEYPGQVPLTTRKYFDYIETKGARVRGDLNAAEAQQIAGIFDRGVRIYHGTDGYAQIGAGMALENYEV